MSEQELLLEVSEGVATITFNRPKVKNAFTDTMREELLKHLENIETDRTVKCVVLTGAGDAFCAGGDIPNMVALQNDDDTRVVTERIQVASQAVQLIRRLPQPVVAAVNGAAAGGGMNLALACDMRVGSESAFFSEAFVRIGLVPDWGGFTFLPQLVGTAKALELMMTGDRINAPEAKALGLLNQVYPTDTFREQAGAFAQRLAAGPSLALARIKQGVYIGAEQSLQQSLSYELQSQKALFLSDDSREGMKAFVEKRPPQFGTG